MPEKLPITKDDSSAESSQKIFGERPRFHEDVHPSTELHSDGSLIRRPPPPFLFLV